MPADGLSVGTCVFGIPGSARRGLLLALPDRPGMRTLSGKIILLS
ncbi:MAG TPA: hypothetical protein VNM72_04090 [Blastocatellia bacterium]|nr:hypothetical protein [Blastocatellia bacterium]